MLVEPKTIGNNTFEVMIKFRELLDKIISMQNRLVEENDRDLAEIWLEGLIRLVKTADQLHGMTRSDEAIRSDIKSGMGDYKTFYQKLIDWKLL
jgi:hypothetical protein